MVKAQSLVRPQGLSQRADRASSEPVPPKFLTCENGRFRKFLVRESQYRLGGSEDGKFLVHESQYRRGGLQRKETHVDFRSSQESRRDFRSSSLNCGNQPRTDRSPQGRPDRQRPQSMPQLPTVGQRAWHQGFCRDRHRQEEEVGEFHQACILSVVSPRAGRRSNGTEPC